MRDSSKRSKRINNLVATTAAISSFSFSEQTWRTRHQSYYHFHFTQYPMLLSLQVFSFAKNTLSLQLIIYPLSSDKTSLRQGHDSAVRPCTPYRSCCCNPYRTTMPSSPRTRHFRKPTLYPPHKHNRTRSFSDFFSHCLHVAFPTLHLYITLTFLPSSLIRNSI